MWGELRGYATRESTEDRSLRARPGLERAHFPVATALLAGLAAEPGLLVAMDIAREEVAALAIVDGIGRRDSGHGAPGTGRRVLPWHARIRLAATEDFVDCGTGKRKIRLRRQFGCRHRVTCLLDGASCLALTSCRENRIDFTYQ